MLTRQSGSTDYKWVVTTAICAVFCVSVIDGTLGYCGCVFPARYMVSGLKSDNVFKMAARVSSTSSEEMASSSEDSAGEDPINIAKDVEQI